MVFSPGEAEVRPLYPSEIVYTTAQKVADLLDIGPQEAVAVSADSESDRVYVTGSDYRSIGFAVNDTILIYSDAQALGIEKTITSIAEGGSNGVALYFTGSFSTSDYQSADNTYVQNTSSFTNGRTRGITKSKVENIILRMQDKIDNITKSAWRPYLVTAEYLNFDTYKPYRRRYYTDYVGTTPLLFRNIQQILRLELWQGDDYREIGAAEARIEISDYSELSGDSIYLAPGNGSVGTLTVGTGTTNWRSDFDNITAAQNLADLINREDRVGKTAVEFSPTFTLEGSTSNVAVDNEFLASANADYGGGKLKVTSMRDGAAGETCTIATSDATNISLSQPSTATTPRTSVSSTTVNVASTSGFVEKGLLQVGNEVLSYTGTTDTTFTGCANVSGTPLTTLNTSGTSITQHKLQIDFQGGSAIGDHARLRDWWLDAESGIVYFNNSYPYFEWNAVKASYIYGERYLERAIEDACTKLVAVDLLLSDDRSVLIPEGTSNVSLENKIRIFDEDVARTLDRYKEIVVFE